MLYLFWKVLACWPQIHVKMGDPAYGGHANGKRTLNFIIEWLRRSPIDRVNGRTLVRYWNTSVTQWRLACMPRRGRIRRVIYIWFICTWVGGQFHDSRISWKNCFHQRFVIWNFHDNWSYYIVYFTFMSFTVLFCVSVHLTPLLSHFHSPNSILWGRTSQRIRERKIKLKMGTSLILLIVSILQLTLASEWGYEGSSGKLIQNIFMISINECWVNFYFLSQWRLNM